MYYSTVLVHLDFDGVADSRLQYAVDLAGDLDACLIGFSATCLRPVHISEMGVVTDEAYRDHAARQVRARFEEMEREFYSVAGDGPNSSWRQEEDLPTDALLRNARAADLVIAGTSASKNGFDPYRDIDPAELVCGAGRPVLFVGEGAKFSHPAKALIGWKDTPEARRAVAFALPFLRLAREVVVATVKESGRDETERALNDVVRFLIRNGIDADPLLIEEKGGPQALLDIAAKEGADLVVTGAYGHSRMRERIFGGFTRTLLAEHALNRLMAG